MYVCMYTYTCMFMYVRTIDSIQFTPENHAVRAEALLPSYKETFKRKVCMCMYVVVYVHLQTYTHMYVCMYTYSTYSTYICTYVRQIP